MKKKIFGCLSVIFACLSVLVLAVGCGVKEQTFSSDAGVSVTLTNEFEETPMTGVTYCVSSKNIVFMAQKESFELVEEYGYDINMSLSEYAQICIDNNSLNSIVNENIDKNLTYFVYTAKSSGIEFSYYAFVKKGTDAFWLCQIACYSVSEDNLKDQIFDWASTIVVV